MTDDCMVVIGDCVRAMADLPERSVDAIVTDPPYELHSGAGRGFMGKTWDGSGVSFDPATWAACLRVLRPGGHLLAFGGTRTVHRIAVAIEDAGFEIRDQIVWLYGSGFPKSHNIGNGFGTALKPAHEPVIVARKPLIGTVAANVAAHGTGALNIDGCRIPGDNPSVSRRNGAVTHLSDRPARETEAEGRMASRQSEEAFRAERPGEQLGRWPANVALDEDAAALLDAQSGERRGGGGKVAHVRPQDNVYDAGMAVRSTVAHDDTGGASRFFYVAKASRSERNAGLDGMPERKVNRYSAMAQGPLPQQTPTDGVIETNHHPTVKPIALMRWLVRLVTPVGGVVLDPFMGSGTTGCAARMEGFRFIGIEQDAEYAAIADRRIRHWAELG